MNAGFNFDIFVGLAECDKRIASCQSKIDSWKVYKDVLKMVDLEMEKKYQDKIDCNENNIKLIKVEKLIYKALSKNNREVFPLFLEKYDELMGVSYDVSGNLVNSGLHLEGEHLEYCRQSLKQREFIKMMCYYGEHRK